MSGNEGIIENPTDSIETLDYTFNPEGSVNLSEMNIPENFHELLGDSSGYLTSAIEDIADAVLQVKAISGDIAKSSVWNKPVVQDAVNFAMGTNNISDYMDYSSLSGESSNFVDYSETVLTKFYTCYEDYTIYAIGVESVVSNVLNELKGTDEDTYNLVVEYMKENNINTLKAFTDDATIGRYLKIAFQRASAPVSAGPGLVAYNIIKTKGLNYLFSMNYKDVIREGLKEFASGKHLGKIPTMGKTFLSGLGVAGAFFAIGIGIDALSGEISWEKVGIRGGQAAVAVGASMAGTAVSSALAGAGAGSWAGPLGMAVGAVISVIGNLIIDGIVHEVKYTENDLPRDYTPISLNDIKEEMKRQGITVNVPKIGDMTIYDAVNYIARDSQNTDVITYLTEASCGYSSWPPEKVEKYDTIAYYAMNCDYYHKDHMGDLTPEEEAFADAMISIFDKAHHTYEDTEGQVALYLEDIILERTDIE